MEQTIDEDSESFESSSNNVESITSDENVQGFQGLRCSACKKLIKMLQKKISKNSSKVHYDEIRPSNPLGSPFEQFSLYSLGRNCVKTAKSLRCTPFQENSIKMQGIP